VSLVNPSGPKGKPLTDQELRDRIDDLRLAIANLVAGLNEDGTQPKEKKEKRQWRS